MAAARTSSLNRIFGPATITAKMASNSNLRPKKTCKVENWKCETCKFPSHDSRPLYWQLCLSKLLRPSQKDHQNMAGWSWSQPTVPPVKRHLVFRKDLTTESLLRPKLFSTALLLQMRPHSFLPSPAAFAVVSAHAALLLYKDLYPCDPKSIVQVFPNPAVAEEKWHFHAEKKKQNGHCLNFQTNDAFGRPRITNLELESKNISPTNPKQSYESKTAKIIQVCSQGTLGNMNYHDMKKHKPPWCGKTWRTMTMKKHEPPWHVTNMNHHDM